jgi:hypothetical protein
LSVDLLKGKLNTKRGGIPPKSDLISDHAAHHSYELFKAVKLLRIAASVLIDVYSIIVCPLWRKLKDKDP